MRVNRRRSPLAGDALVPKFEMTRPSFSESRHAVFKRASPASGLLRVIFFALLMFTGFAHAQAIEPMPFANHAQELRFQHLTAQLRCPMCQNETLADSNAPIARDLRNRIFQLMQQGKTDAQIKHYLVARYSNYILYDPPLKPGTWLLWFGPLLILLGGSGVVLAAIRKRHRSGGMAAQSPVDSGSNNGPDNGPDNGDDW